MKPTFLLAVCAAFVAGLLASPALGAEAPPPVDPAVARALKTIKPDDYPSANTVLLAHEQQMVFEASGQFHNVIRQVRMVLTAEGKGQAAVMPLNYTRDAEKMEVLTARVIRPTGEAIPVGKAGIKDTEQSGAMNIYDPNGRSLQVTFEGVSVGDAVELVYRFTRVQPTRPGFFNDTFVFQAQEPVLAASYTVDGPRAVPLTWRIYHRERSPLIRESKKTSGERTTYRWSTRNVPQLVPETLMNGTTELPLLVVTSDPSWQSFSAWWAALTESQMTLTPELAAKATALTKTASSDEEKIRALYNFVAADIRYRGLGVGPRTGYTPRKASETLASRWGVCRDVAILLTAMLRHQGFDAYPVLTNMGDPVLSAIAYEGFNHAIVAIRSPGEKSGFTYLDPTAKNVRDLLPANEREQNVLVATKKGEPLGQIPALTPEANRGLARTRTVVDSDGGMTSEVVIETRGFFDMILRSVAATTGKEEQRQIAEMVIHNAMPDAELSRFTVSNPLALDKPMQVEIGLKVKSAAVKASNYRLLRTLVTSGALGIDALLSPVLGGLESRKFTLDAQSTLEWAQEEEVVLPPGLAVEALPNDAHVDNAVAKIDSACTSPKTGTLQCRRSFQVKTRFIAPNQYRALKAVLGDVAIISRQPVILGAK